MPHSPNTSTVDAVLSPVKNCTSESSTPEGHGTATRKKRIGNAKTESWELGVGSWELGVPASAGLNPIFHLPSPIFKERNVNAITSSASAQLVSRQIGFASCSTRVTA